MKKNLYEIFSILLISTGILHFIQFDPSTMNSSSNLIAQSIMYVGSSITFAILSKKY